MKKYIFLLILSSILIQLIGCGLPENEIEALPESEELSEIQELNEPQVVDLTILSSTMVYSEVFNIVSNPNEYIGKMIKMKGAFSVYQDESTGAIYYACIISDATACCAQGIEFVLSGDYKYPDDYPELGEEITVIGEFETYREGEYLYCRLKNAELIF